MDQERDKIPEHNREDVSEEMEMDRTNGTTHRGLQDEEDNGVVPPRQEARKRPATEWDQEMRTTCVALVRPEQRVQKGPLYSLDLNRSLGVAH